MSDYIDKTIAMVRQYEMGKSDWVDVAHALADEVERLRALPDAPSSISARKEKVSLLLGIINDDQSPTLARALTDAWKEMESDVYYARRNAEYWMRECEKLREEHEQTSPST